MLKLVANSSASGAREFPLGPGTNYAGRGFSNDVKIEDPSVSTIHAQIIVENGQVIIKDLDSMNGTYINGLQVKEAIIEPGQSLRFGAVELVIQDDAPNFVEGIPVANPIAAEALRAARERLIKGNKK